MMRYLFVKILVVVGILVLNPENKKSSERRLAVAEGANSEKFPSKTIQTKNVETKSAQSGGWLFLPETRRTRTPIWKTNPKQRAVSAAQMKKSYDIQNRALFRRLHIDEEG